MKKLIKQNIGLFLLVVFLSAATFAYMAGKDIHGDVKQTRAHDRSLVASTHHLMMMLRKEQRSAGSGNSKTKNRQVALNYTLTINRLRHAAPGMDVSLAQVRIQSKSGAVSASGSSRIRDMSSAVKNALGVKAIKVKIDGAWTNLAGLRRWLGLLQKEPAAITGLSVSPNHFEMEVITYGR